MALIAKPVSNSTIKPNIGPRMGINITMHMLKLFVKMYSGKVPLALCWLTVWFNWLLVCCATDGGTGTSDPMTVKMNAIAKMKMAV